MIPLQSLAPAALPAPYLPPDGQDLGRLLDRQEGGIALQNGTQGLEVQPWTLTVTPLGEVQVTAPSVATTTLFTRPGITWARLSFDQNMFPVISFMDGAGSWYYWFDPLISQFAFVQMASDVMWPCVTMDDKRSRETILNKNDIILVYLRGGSLYYRQQRDRYGVEYLLTNTITPPQPVLWKVGMTSALRLQFTIRPEAFV